MPQVAVFLALGALIGPAGFGLLFGTSIIWGGLAAATGTTIAFTIVALLLRPVAFLPALIPAPISWRNRALIAWFGPRGLSSLLLVMLAVFANIDGSEYLLQVSCLVVLVSVVLHGFSPMVLIRGETVDTSKGVSPQPARTLSVREVPDDRPRGQTITLNEYLSLRTSGAPVVLVDSRTERTYHDTDPIPDSVRVHPDHPVADAFRQQLPTAATLVVLCA